MNKPIGSVIRKLTKEEKKALIKILKAEWPELFEEPNKDTEGGYQNERP